MLVTAQTNRGNQYRAVAVATATVIAFAVLGWLLPWGWLGIVLGPLVYWWMRRGCKRRMQVMTLENKGGQAAHGTLSVQFSLFQPAAE